MRRPAAALAAAVAAGLALAGAGCGSSAPVPQDTFYRLRVSPPIQADARAALPGVLMVGAFEGDGLIRGRSLVYTSTGDREGIRQHNYYHWVDSPSRLVQAQLVNFLKESEVARAVVTPDMRVRSDYELIGRILRFDRVFKDTGSGVVAELELAVVRQSDRKLVMVDSYRAELPSRNDSVDASVEAMNGALEQIFATFASDIGHRTHESARQPLRP